MGFEPGRCCVDGRVREADPQPVFPLMERLPLSAGFYKFINKINCLYVFRDGPAWAGGRRDPTTGSILPVSGRLAGELATAHLAPAIYVTHFKLREAEHMMGRIAARPPQCRAGMPGQNQQSEF